MKGLEVLQHSSTSDWEVCTNSTKLRTVGLRTGIRIRDIEYKKQGGSVFERCTVLPQRTIRAYCWKPIMFNRINKFFRQ